MKAFYLFLASLFLFSFCSFSQSRTLPEVKKKIAEWRLALNLDPAQVKKLEAIETDFLTRSGKLNAKSKNYSTRLSSLKQQRNDRFQKVLSREQFVKLDMIENNRIKPVPIRAD